MTNGHAARMRYSRFRASLLGLEPQRRRNRRTDDKSKVTKTSKSDKNITPKASTALDDSPTCRHVKEEADVDDDDDAGEQSVLLAAGLVSPHVKTERDGQAPCSYLLPSMPMPMPMPMPDASRQPSRMRLLTPCSESDMPGHHAAGPPSGELFPADGDAAFGVGCYDFDGYPVPFMLGGAAEHHAHQDGDGLTVAPARTIMAHDTGVVVKQDEWDAHRREMEHRDCEWATV